ncbi:MAG TPA: hypothetical protein DF383_00875 [Deltaproteobacteria bacterium]|nr:hypothetical protein [Deltaproteobacteria bacterium]
MTSRRRLYKKIAMPRVFRQWKNLAILAAALLLTLNLSLAAHSHGSAEKVHHCATCRLLPQGIQGTEPARIVLSNPLTCFSSPSLELCLDLPHLNFLSASIRGPPSLPTQA